MYGTYGMTFINLHLGAISGDLLKVALRRLKCPVDFLIAGPPCPPWAAQGNKKSLKDARANVFTRIIAWTVFLIKCGGLLCVILENVAGILVSHGWAFR